MRMPVLALAAFALAGPLAAQSRVPDMAALDWNRDGAMDLEEAYIAAWSLWTAIDPETYLQTEALHNQPETLKIYQLGGRLEGTAYVAANPDDDHGITRDEYRVVVQQRFEEADSDHDGSIDGAEFATEAGQSLLAVIQI